MKHILYICFCAFLFACNSTEPKLDNNSIPLQYIDLTSSADMSMHNTHWQVTKRIDPRYPSEAARQGLSGCVQVMVGINGNGRMAEYKIKSSYPEDIFDNAAANALSKWRWKASELNANKDPILTIIQLDFMVQGSSNRDEAEKMCGYEHF